MRLRGKLVGELTENDIQFLRENLVPESCILEYKLELPGNSDKDRKEFLADVTTMVNTARGVILYGVKTGRNDKNDDTGIRAAIPGIISLTKTRKRSE